METTTETITDKPLYVVMNDFFEETPGSITGRSSAATLPPVMDSSAVAQFLSRPVLIRSDYCAIGGLYDVRFDPWTAFLTHPTISPRISYFGRLRGDLVVRAQINGTPMHFADIRLAYRMHPGVAATGDYFWEFANSPVIGDPVRAQRIITSQLLGCSLNPCRENVCDLRIPYVSPVAGFSMVGGFNQMGTILLLSYSPLRHATDGTEGITVDFYVHMENVVLDVPTAHAQGYTLEEASNVISRFLKRTARATQIAQEWMPLITSTAMMGFSRPLTQEPTSNMRFMPYNLANYDAPDTAGKLSLSVNAEHTLGLQDAGGAGEDELMLSKLAARVSYLHGTEWTSDMPKGEFLIGSVVTPSQYMLDEYIKPSITYDGGTPHSFGPVPWMLTIPCSHAALLARMWRADMEYTINVVASPYHKGRLRVFYEPILTTYSVDPSPPPNLNNSVIIDLAEQSSAVLRVPWQMRTDMCHTTYPDGLTTSENTCVDETLFLSRLAYFSAPFLGDTHNGYIKVEVLSPLTSVAPLPVVNVLVSVAAHNMVLYSPAMPTYVDGDGVEHQYVVDVGSVLTQSYDISGADAIVSVRQLMKRYDFEYGLAYSSVADSLQYYEKVVSFLLPAFLPVPGYDKSSQGIQTYVGQCLDMDSQAIPMNATNMTVRNWVSMAFVLERGGIRWKVISSVKNGATALAFGTHVSREWRPLPDTIARRISDDWVVPYNASGALTPHQRCMPARHGWHHWRGGEGTQFTTNVPACATSDVEIPFVSLYRAANPRIPRMARSWDMSSNVVRLTSRISKGTSNAAGASILSHVVYTAVAEDYNLQCYQHAPAFLLRVPLPNAS